MDELTDVAAFYDALADDYELVYGGEWDAAIERQGDVLDGLIRRLHGGRPRDVLDCSCGIGTQAIGLARLGYRVTGTDISRRSLERAGTEARRRDVELELHVADFRELPALGGPFDVVISCDNAIPHLLSDADVERAFVSMRSNLRRDGVLLVSVRDYERALRERPTLAPPVFVPGAPRRLVLRLHEWDADDSPFHTVRLLVVTEDEPGWSVVEHRTRYRAIERAALTAAAGSAGLLDVTWIESADSGWYQPVLAARA